MKAEAWSGMESSNPTNYEFLKTQNTIEKILEHSTEGIAIIGDDERIEYINDRVCEIIGKTRDEVLGQSFMQFVHQNSLDLVTKRYASRLDGEQIPSSFQVQVLRGDDETRDVRIHSTVLMNGENKIKILAQILDITEEKRTQQALSESEFMYQTLVKTMNEGLGVIDNRGVLVQSNVALSRMLGYTEKELIGKTTADIMHGLEMDAVFEKIKDRKAGKSERYETHLVHQSGKLIPVMISASPLLNETGGYTGSCIVITNITKQKIAEDTSTSELLENILNAVSKSARIISNSRTIQHISDIPLKERSLDEILCESMKDASILLEDVVISLSRHVSNARIRADDYLEILLSDLLVNAYDGNPADTKRIWVDLNGSENFYELCISDNGLGMMDTVKRNLCELSSRIEGVGFHLACHIVEKYGGTIEVLDRVSGDPSQGKKIRVVLPRLE
ncbi:MAG: PAS domain-containing sensor histidine kinase [Candidatus Thorarchaeota archaeon]|jgi:PAS domain S-box-containing protein